MVSYPQKSIRTTKTWRQPYIWVGELAWAMVTVKAIIKREKWWPDSCTHSDCNETRAATIAMDYEDHGIVVLVQRFENTVEQVAALNSTCSCECISL